MYKAYFKELLKKYKILVGSFALLAIVALPIFMFHSVENYHVIINDFYQTTPDLYWQDHLNNLSKPIYGLVVVAVIIISVLLNIESFKMQAVDFFSVLPLRKEKKKMTEYLFGWSSIFVPLIIGYLITIMVLYRSSRFDLKAYLCIVGTDLSSGILLYSLMMLVLTLCTSYKEAFINVMIMLGSIIYFPFAIRSFMGDFGMFGSHFLDDEGEILSQFFSSILTNINYNFSFYLSGKNSLIIIVLHLVCSIFTVFGLYVFSKKKRAEDTGIKRKNYLLYYICVGVSVIVLLQNFSADKWVAILFIFLFYFILSVLFERSKKNILCTLGVVMLSLISLFGMRQLLISTEFFGSFRSYKTVEGVSNLIIQYYPENRTDTNGDLVWYQIDINPDDKDYKKYREVLNEFQDEQTDYLKKHVGDFSIYNNTSDISVFYHTEKEENIEIYSYHLKEKDSKKWINQFEKVGLEFKEVRAPLANSEE